MEAMFLEYLLDNVHDSVVVVDRDLVIRYANRRFRMQLEAPSEGVEGAGLLEVCDIENSAELVETIEASFDGVIGELTGSNVLNRRDLTETITCSPLTTGTAEMGNVSVQDEESDSPVEQVLIVARETTPSEGGISIAQRLEYQDPVTGLLNRRSIRLVTDREIKRADRGTPTLAMLFVMLRNFKEINQMHGHTVGDLLLENTGIRIRETIRNSDYVFRWEGTNLVVLLPELATPLDALIVAEKIQSAVTVPYRFRGLDLAPACHIGISLYPTDASDPDELFNCANSAVIEAERQHQPVLHYDHQTHQAASDRLFLRTGLQRAFERGELELYYQPIVDLDGVIRGGEALMRWNHPDRGLLGPGDFIGIAEDSRLIAPIDKVALYHAARSVVAWSNKYDLFLTLNISATNISDSSLPVVVEQAISDAGLTDPGRLKLELTESRTIENQKYSRSAMEELTEMGVDIWIDDFGTGQSSLSYLKHLPVSTVKIDKDFIAELGQNQEDIDYLEGIINTIRSRGKHVVVEGVTTRDQYELLRTLPIDYLQGFYFSRPVPASEFELLLAKGSLLP
ncbi:MAG: EAL domain-containing protein [Alkalispirochaeta sp.]